eukprot:4264363-Prorocentrum_lima.AAC.1
MTSSLVGSEMCIRDSRRLVHLAAMAPQANSLQLAWHMLSRSLFRSLAVSYTHLTLPTICSV